MDPPAVFLLSWGSFPAITSHEIALGLEAILLGDLDMGKRGRIEVVPGSDEPNIFWNTILYGKWSRNV